MIKDWYDAISQYEYDTINSYLDRVYRIYILLNQYNMIIKRQTFV